ncbi:MAG: FecR domain-containing protein [Bacteroidales bacterium]|nr:FecR domain-containing protein [Bacteroidales bacterium]
MKQSNIDIELIRKKALGELTPEEKKAYNEWLGKKETHKLYANKAEYYFSHNKVVNEQPADFEKAWLRILPRLVHKPKLRIPRWVGAAASIAVIALVSYTTFLLVKTSHDQPVVVQNATNIQAGSKTAELQLSNGQVVRLGSGDMVLQETDGTTINTASSEVSYANNVVDNETVLYNTIRLNKGEEFTLTLADGTRVWINSMSELKFPVQFQGDTRRVELVYGEVSFDVAHNAEKPFILKTPVHDVEVLGTRFNVSCYANDGTVQTTLAEGKVRINNVIGQLESIEIEPDQQYVFDKKDLTASVKDVNAEAYLAWTKGRFQFEDENLESIFKKLERWYNVDVYFVNNQARQEYFNGRLPRFENIDVILDMIEEVSDVEIELKDNAVILK